MIDNLLVMMDIKGKFIIIWELIRFELLINEQQQLKHAHIDATANLHVKSSPITGTVTM